MVVQEQVVCQGLCLVGLSGVVPVLVEWHNNTSSSTTTWRQQLQQAVQATPPGPSSSIISNIRAEGSGSLTSSSSNSCRPS